MASVPSAGCLLAKNQYYRSKCPRGRELPRLNPFAPGRGGSSGGGRLSPRSLSPCPDRLPEIIDKCWWIKSFFHSEPSPPTVGRKTLSAS
ncbi:Pancreatic progenitor cell differentiation and proliferation factor-like, partial [Cuculus canorus]